MTEEEKIDRTPVAQDIWCYSTKEKAFTWHVVVNHDAHGYVDRVQCKVSGVIHKYKRLSKPGSAKPLASKSVIRRSSTGTALGTSSSSPSSSAALEDVWFRGLKNWGDKEVLKYDPKVSFLIEQALDHPTFGKGVVQKRRDNKIEVLFRTGIKVLPSAK